MRATINQMARRYENSRHKMEANYTGEVAMKERGKFMSKDGHFRVIGYSNFSALNFEVVF